MPQHFAGLEKLALTQQGRLARRLFILSGPSGVGKAAVTSALLERNAFLQRARTFTTRSMRAGEHEGEQYFFVSEPEFEARYASGEIMERTEVYGTGALYGMPSNMLDALPPDSPFLLAEVDVNGKDFLVSRFPKESVSIFITAMPSDLIARIRQRASYEANDPAELAARLRTARDQMAVAPGFDYVVVNEHGRLEETIAQIEAIILAERLKPPAGIDLVAEVAGELDALFVLAKRD